MNIDFCTNINFIIHIQSSGKFPEIIVIFSWQEVIAQN